MLSSLTETPTHRLLAIAAIYMEMGNPVPVDLVFQLNSRGIIFDMENLQC